MRAVLCNPVTCIMQCKSMFSKLKCSIVKSVKQYCTVCIVRSLVHLSLLQCCGVHCAVQFSALQCNAGQCSAVQCCRVQCSVGCFTRGIPLVHFWKWTHFSSVGGGSTGSTLNWPSGLKIPHAGDTACTLLQENVDPKVIQQLIALWLVS